MLLIYPMPDIWSATYNQLRKVWMRTKNSAIPAPPPLILNGWVFCSDAQKSARWAETVLWAEQYGFAHLLPTIHGADA